jgi:hypothetical protein
MLSGRASILPFSPEAAHDLNRRRSIACLAAVLQAGPPRGSKRVRQACRVLGGIAFLSRAFDDTAEGAAALGG